MTILRTLSALLPSAEENEFLEACLHVGPRAHEGWTRWCERGARFARPVGTDLSRHRTLLPLLERSIGRNRLEIEPEALSYVRAATLREELRAVRLRGIAVEVIESLEGAGARPVLLRGVALAAAVYEAWHHRHCHDIDVFLRPENQDAAAAALLCAGCTSVSSHTAPKGTVVIRHRSGVPIGLHTRPFGVAYYDIDSNHFAEPRERLALNGVEASVPLPEATLVHVLGRAACTANRTLRWVADAWHLLEAHRDLDWTDVCARVERHRLGLPLSLFLRYLEQFGMRIPVDVVLDLERRQARTNQVEEDVALGAALAARSGDLRSLWRSSGNWSERARIARWMIAPTAGYIRSTFEPGSRWQYPFAYSRRPVRFLLGRVARRRSPRDRSSP